MEKGAKHWQQGWMTQPYDWTGYKDIYLPYTSMNDCIINGSTHSFSSPDRRSKRTKYRGGIFRSGLPFPSSLKDQNRNRPNWEA
eukprot:5750142-Amphidinium_carterae.1